jgi:hypothetical protein
MIIDMRKNKPLNILLLIIGNLLLIGAIAFGAIHFYNGFRQQQELEKNISASTAPPPEEITVDFDNQIETGSPLIFGGSHIPPPEHGDVFKQMKDLGVTMMRQDLAIPYSLPRDITIEDYKTNKNNIQDPKNWDWKTINAVKNNIHASKSNGMPVMAIFAYAPRWLTSDGTPNGVPKDWAVYQDIVSKLYTIYRADLDYAEIGNEPDHPSFLNVKNSTSTKEEAYEAYYKATYEALKKVDTAANDNKRLKIGVGVESNPRISKILESLLKKQNVIKSYPPDFISFHTYDMDYSKSLELYRGYADKYLKKDFPIYVTEWNYEDRTEASAEYKSGEKSITFVGNRFVDFLNNGVDGANYFNLLPLNVKNQILGPSIQTMGFYLWNDNKVVFLPQAKTWRLMSKGLNLGTGPSRIYKVDNQMKELNAAAFVNAKNQEGIVVVSSAFDSRFVQFNFENIQSPSQWRKLMIYEADTTHDGKEPIQQEILYMKDGRLSKKLYLPSNSIVGIVITSDVSLYEKLKYKVLSL